MPMASPNYGNFVVSFSDMLTVNQSLAELLSSIHISLSFASTRVVISFTTEPSSFAISTS